MSRGNRFIVKVIVGYVLAFVTVAALAIAVLGDAGAQEAPASAPPGCLPHDQMSQMLAKEHGELVMIYARTRGQPIEFYVSRAGTWTAVATSADQMSCMVQAGDGWTGDRPDPLPQSGPAMYRILPNRPWPL